MNAERELESVYRNVKDIYDALEGKTFADAQLIRRLLRGTLPWEMTQDSAPKTDQRVG